MVNEVKLIESLDSDIDRSPVMAVALLLTARQ
jgi:hypothetical protein